MANNLMGGLPRTLTDEELMELYGGQAAETIVRNEEPARSTPSSTGILGGFSPEDIGDYGQLASTDGRGTNTPSRDPRAGQRNPNNVFGGMSAADLSNTVTMDQFGRGMEKPEVPMTKPQYNVPVNLLLEQQQAKQQQGQAQQEQGTQLPSPSGETEVVDEARGKVIAEATKKALQDPELSEGQRQRIIDRYEEQRGKFNLPALFGGIGATLQGGSGAEGAGRILDLQRQQFQDELGAFDTQREQQYQDEIRQRERQSYESARDPNSTKSKLARQLMKNMNENVPEDFTYQQMVEFNPVLGQLFDRQMQQAQLRQEAALRNREMGLENRQLNLETEARTGPSGEYVSEEEAQQAREVIPAIDSTRSSIEESIESIREGGDMTDIRNRLTAVKADLRNLIEKGAVQQFTEEELDDLLYSGRWTTDNTRIQKLEYLDSLLTGAKQDVAGQGTRRGAQQSLTNPTSPYDTRNTNRTVRMVGQNGSVIEIPFELARDAEQQGYKLQ